jgi:hypothetical protein
MDRTPKFPLEQIAIATRGAMNQAEVEVERKIFAAAPARKKNRE